MIAVADRSYTLGHYNDLRVPFKRESKKTVADLHIQEKTRTNPLPWRGQFSPQLVETLIQTYAVALTRAVAWSNPIAAQRLLGAILDVEQVADGMDARRDQIEAQPRATVRPLDAVHEDPIT